MSGGRASSLGVIWLDDGYLTLEDFYGDGFAKAIALVVHEYWHVVTKTLGSIANEVSAYNMETIVQEELGLEISKWREDLLQYGMIVPEGHSTLTTNPEDLCKARQIILDNTSVGYDDFRLWDNDIFTDFSTCE